MDFIKGFLILLSVASVLLCLLISGKPPSSAKSNLFFFFSKIIKYYRVFIHLIWFLKNFIIWSGLIFIQNFWTVPSFETFSFACTLFVKIYTPLPEIQNSALNLKINWISRPKRKKSPLHFPGKKSSYRPASRIIVFWGNTVKNRLLFFTASAASAAAANNF